MSGKTSEGAREPIWVYRLESLDPKNGLWYNADGEFVHGISKVAGCKTAYLPMGYDTRYHSKERNWVSGCLKVEDLAHWFSESDAKQLWALGFRFWMFQAVEYEIYDHEVAFNKETVLQRLRLKFNQVYFGRHEI